MNKLNEIIINIAWYIGNMIILSNVIYISFTDSHKGEIVNNILICIFMILWVFGQINLLKNGWDKSE